MKKVLKFFFSRELSIFDLAYIVIIIDLVATTQNWLYGLFYFPCILMSVVFNRIFERENEPSA